MTFAHPLWLLLPLAVLPAAWLAWAWQKRRAEGMARHFPAGMGTPAAALPWSRLAWRFLFLTWLGMALARPQWGDETTEEVHSGRDVLFVIDTSRSMLATDAPPSRIESAKLACLDLLRAIPSERIGVIAFAGSAYPVAPLTTDHDAIRETIIGLDTTVLPVAGTNLAPAIEAAAEAFKNDPDRRRALVIFSDGEDLEGEWKDVLDLAKKNHMVVLAFALGTEAGSLLPDPKSEGGFIRDPAGRPVLSKRDMTTLKALAEATGGLAMPLDPGTPVAATVKETLATLDRGESEKKTRTTAAERFQWPLGAALIVLPVCLLAGRGARKARPRPKAAAALATALLAGFAPPPARAAPAPPPLEQAFQAHKDGHFDDAIKLGGPALVDPDPKRRAIAAANFASSLYDAGRSALPAEKPTADDMRKTVRDWEDALDHYDSSLRSRPDPKVAQNREVVAKALEDLRQRMKEQQKQEQQQKQQQKDQQGGKDQKDQQKQEGNQDQKDQQNQGGSQDKQDSQSGRDKPENQDQQGQGQEKSDPKDGGQKDEQGQPKEGGEGQDKEDQSGKEGKDPKDGQGKEGQEQKDKAGQGQEGQEGEPKDASSHGSTTREMKAGEEGQVGGARMVVGPDGRLQIPEDPRERARLLEMIRRNLKQRSTENRSVRLIPKDSAPKPTSRKTW